jgi:hypothetical protein
MDFTKDPVNNFFSARAGRTVISEKFYCISNKDRNLCFESSRSMYVIHIHLPDFLVLEEMHDDTLSNGPQNLLRMRIPAEHTHDTYVPPSDVELYHEGFQSMHQTRLQSNSTIRAMGNRHSSGYSIDSLLRPRQKRAGPSFAFSMFISALEHATA